MAGELEDTTYMQIRMFLYAPGIVALDGTPGGAPAVLLALAAIVVVVMAGWRDGGPTRASKHTASPT